MHTSGRKPKSWELNYPALAILVNGGYYADYAGVMGSQQCTTAHGTSLCLDYVPMLRGWQSGPVNK